MTAPLFLCAWLLAGAALQLVLSDDERKGLSLPLAAMLGPLWLTILNERDGLETE